MILNTADLCAGIGGFTYGLQMAGGYETSLFCEINDYCQRLLAQNYPGVPLIGDINDITTAALQERGIGRVDLVTAGFPCQPFSTAGKGRGIQDERFLWKELYRAIQVLNPLYVLLENVPALRTNSEGVVFAGILADLAAIGFDAEWTTFPASAIGARHRRNRLWLVAYPNAQGFPGRAEQTVGQSGPLTKPQRLRGEVSHAEVFGSQRLWSNRLVFSSAPPQSEVFRRYSSGTGRREWQTEPRLDRVVNGFPGRVDRIKGLGNSIVPQVAALIGELIQLHLKEWWYSG